MSGIHVKKSVSVVWFSVGVLALLLRILVVGGSPILAPIGLPLGVIPAIPLHRLGVRLPWVDEGGGLVWLTAWGICLVYFAPALLLVTVQLLLARRADRRAAQSQARE
ncbi:MAG: hypothetical protein U0X73_06205 [Thermoanaerobaculia bacterium]